MKFKSLFITVLASTMIFAGACKKGETSSLPSESSIDESIIVDDFQKGDNSHLNQEKANTTTIRFHYHRNDNDGTYSSYRKWQIWAWDISNGGNGAAYTFDHWDPYGVYVDVSQDEISGGKNMNVVGFIVAITSDWTKDPDGDRNITVPGQAPGGIYDIYLLTKSDKIYYDPESPFKNSLE